MELTDVEVTVLTDTYKRMTGRDIPRDRLEAKCAHLMQLMKGIQDLVRTGDTEFMVTMRKIREVLASPEMVQLEAELIEKARAENASAAGNAASIVA